MRHTFHAEQWLPYPVEQVFAFFANPDNLPVLMPGWQKARIERLQLIGPPRPPQEQAALRVAAGAGTTMTLSFRPFPLSPFRMTWDAEITEFAWNDRFCDTQTRGPFAFWRHCHRISAQTKDEPGGGLVLGSILRDQVEYELPLGQLGDLAQKLFVNQQLRSTFLFRQKRTMELLGPGRAG